MKQTLKIAVWIVLLQCVCACKTMDAHLFPKKEKQLSGISMGAVGIKNGLFEDGFEAKAQPNIKKRLAVNVQEKAFDKKHFKRFEQMRDSEAMGLHYIDSLPIKPVYFEVELTDDIAYATAIRKDENKGVYAFAKANKDTRVVTKISLVFPDEGLATKAVYYVSKGKHGAGQLVALFHDGSQKQYQFSDAIIFDYEVSYFCWGTDDYGQIAAFDLVEEGKPCAHPLSRKTKTFNKERNLFNY
jgi:hypothetical protein